MITADVTITDEQWQWIRHLIPQRTSSRRGGRPAVDERGCLEGILWALRNRARWRDVAGPYPSGSTCWRRQAEWSRTGLLETLWHAYLDSLDGPTLVDWYEALTHAGPPQGVRADWMVQMAEELRSYATARVLRAMVSRCPIEVGERW